MTSRPAPSPPDPEQNAATVRLLLAFGAGIREARLRAGLTQAGLAQRCGLRQHEVSRIENGQFAVTLDTLAALAEAFDGQVWGILEAAKLSSGWTRAAPAAEPGTTEGPTPSHP